MDLAGPALVGQEGDPAAVRRPDRRRHLEAAGLELADPPGRQIHDHQLAPVAVVHLVHAPAREEDVAAVRRDPWAAHRLHLHVGVHVEESTGLLRGRRGRQGEGDREGEERGGGSEVAAGGHAGLLGIASRARHSACVAAGDWGQSRGPRARNQTMSPRSGASPCTPRRRSSRVRHARKQRETRTAFRGR